LKCSDKATDEAVLGELGWWRLKARADMLRLRFWASLVNMSLDSVAKKVYVDSKWELDHDSFKQELLARPMVSLVGLNAERKRAVKQFMKPFIQPRSESWCFGTCELLTRYGLLEYWNASLLPPNWDSIVFKAVMAKEQKEWHEMVWLKPKLRTYRTLKSELKCEPYLLQSDGEKSVYDLFKLRCGTNTLRIETGRHERVLNDQGKKVKMPENLRKCLLCLDGVESEAHFLLDCPAFKPQRDYCFKQLESVLNEEGLKFNHLNRQQRVQLLLMGQSFSDYHGTILPIVKSFVGKIYSRRQKWNVFLH
jgi:hypothetical protein